MVAPIPALSSPFDEREPGVTSDGRVLLTDFGIAKGLQPGDDDLTSDNVMMGTAKYLSPEQVRGRRLDGRADLYSLALVLYECLAGRVPFLGETDADTALALAEAGRCLNCDVQTVFTTSLCIECDACIDVCPVDCLAIVPNATEGDILHMTRNIPAEP